MHSDFCMISDRPETLLVDEQNRPHCDKGPFCRWRDGTALYAVHGARVPGWIVETPELITPEKIDAESNAEVKRVMVERFGQERYIREGGAKLLHQDSFGKLWRKDQGEDQPIIMVEVVNSTPEPDGTRNTYFLDVSSAEEALGWPIKTARDAVAATFGMRGEEYAPYIET